MNNNNKQENFQLYYNRLQHKIQIGCNGRIWKKVSDRVYQKFSLKCTNAVYHGVRRPIENHPVSQLITDLKNKT